MLLYFLDEHKLIQNLPRYVTDNPDNMPTTRLFEEDLSFILKKFELFDSRIDAIGSALSAMMKEIQQVSHTQIGLSLHTDNSVAGMNPSQLQAFCLLEFSHRNHENSVLFLSHVHVQNCKAEVCRSAVNLVNGANTTGLQPASLHSVQCCCGLFGFTVCKWHLKPSG